MMSRAKRLLFIPVFAFLLFLSGCSQLSSKETTDELTYSDDFDTFMLEVFKDYAASDALTLHYTLKNPENYDITLDEVNLGEIDFSDLDGMKQDHEVLVAHLKSFDYDKLSADQQLTYDIVLSYIENDSALYDLFFYQEVLDPTTGIQTQLPVLLAEYTFYDTEDVENYILLLNSVDEYYQSIIDFQKEKSAQGLFMADFTADDIILQCQSFIADPESNLLLEIFEEKLDSELPSLTDEEKQGYIQQNKEAVTNSIIPAYQLLIDGLTELKGTGTNEGGLYYFEKGSNYYPLLVRSKTGSDKTPEELISLVEESMQDCITNMSLIYMKDPDIFSKLSDIEYAYTDPSEVLEHLKSSMLESFPEPADVDYTIKYVHESLQENISPAFYLTPQIDNITSNVIYINGSDKYNSDELFPTLAHEGYPGHLYQISYFYNTDPAEIRTILNFSGYAEGWATYVEGLSYQWSGLDETIADVMQADLAYSLCIYARIDLGIHHEGWLLSDVEDYLSELGITDTETANEIYKALISAPGNYLSYCIGSLEFEELRTKAEDMLDDLFNEKDFHQFLLDIGPGQFDIIEKYMDQWIAKQLPGES